jgi:uncharacterized protein DUF4383
VLFRQTFWRALVAGRVVLIRRFACQGDQHARTNRELFAVFMLNPFHNIVHIGRGAFWLLAAFALTPTGTEMINIAIGGISALATVLGILGYFSCCPSRAAWLSAITGFIW